MFQAEKRVYIFIQAYNATFDKYYEEFKVLVAAVWMYCGTFVEPCKVKVKLEIMGVTKDVDKNLL